MAFEPVEQQPDFPALEERVLERWRERDIFARSLAAREDGPLYSFYEGPPTANGRPGVHHVESRVFKDIFPRHRTMKGYHVPRKAGWDCHGIPVELEVEKELGFTRKQDIEDYGVAAFNARCRESVTRYVAEWERMTERVGFWVDTQDAYWTMASEYVDSVWWSLKRLWEDGLVYEGHRVVPYCPRCGTALSDHEVAQGYRQATDPSVYVRFPVEEGPLAQHGASLLVWTTTPWTLISNTAVAVGPDVRYVLARAAGDDYPVVLAADLVEAALGPGAEIWRDVGVDELRGLHYSGPFEYFGPDDPGAWRYVTVAGFVTTTEGTGIVHLAPAFGEDDMAVAREHGLPVFNPVDAEGRFDASVTDFAGRFVKAADPAITEHLRDRGLLLRAGEYTHTYPFCWRCETPLLYYAKPSWYIATTRLRDRLLTENAGVDWHPEHIRDGRYGDWLRNNVDWALSRERYWGTPLPLWRCSDCDAVTAVGSRAELGELAGRDLSDLDPHRPHVDDVTFDCPACHSGVTRRVPEVIDAWYDSGSMPFGQFGYPHAPGSEAAFKAAFPADFIAEAIDQTRGWFYSLMAVATLLFDRNSYRTVLCLGHIVDADGRKMSKSLGNILDPWDLIDTRGADALRWLLLTDGSPWAPRRVGDEAVTEVVRKVLLTLWNTYYFFVTYARIDGWEPDRSQAPDVGGRPVMDRWVLAELADTVRVVDGALDGYDATTAGRRLAGFVDDLSNWYVRRTRRRFWAPDSWTDDERLPPGGRPEASQAPEGGGPQPGGGPQAPQAPEGGGPQPGGGPQAPQAPEGGGSRDDKDAAFATLHECLVTVAALAAPFVPFLADELFENLVRAVDDRAPDSVHLLDYPVPDAAADDAGLRAAMETARRITELGRRARNDAQIAVRQPLRQALVTLPPGERARWDEVAGVVAEELNVKRLDTSGDESGKVRRRLKPRFRALGPDFGQRTPAVAAAIGAAEPDALAGELGRTGRAQVTVDGQTVEISADHVEVLEEAVTGWEVATDGLYGVAVDLAVDDGLRREGLARELVRVLNDLRKRHGLALDERIRLTVAADGELAAALDAHREEIAAETLATELVRADAEDGEEVVVGEHAAAVRLTRAVSLDSGGR